MASHHLMQNSKRLRTTDRCTVKNKNGTEWNQLLFSVVKKKKKIEFMNLINDVIKYGYSIFNSFRSFSANRVL